MNRHINLDRVGRVARALAVCGWSLSAIAAALSGQWAWAGMSLMFVVVAWAARL